MNIYCAHAAARILSWLERVGVTRRMLEKRTSEPDAEFLRARIRKGLRNFHFIYRGEIPADGALLEFGTGKHAVDLQLAHILGFNRMVTVDITNHIELSWIEAGETFAEHADLIHALFAIDPDVVAERAQFISRSTSVDDFLDRIRCRFVTFRDISSGFCGRPVDLWYSESNLQRLPLDSVMDVLSTAAGELKPGGYAFHRLDVADIHSQPAYQLAADVHRFDFLRHGDLAWRFLNNDRYSSQNRLRIPHYDMMFGQIGLRLEKAEYLVHEGDEDYVKQLEVAPLFRCISPRYLAIAHANLMYRKVDVAARDVEDEPRIAWCRNSFPDTLPPEFREGTLRDAAAS